MKRLNLSEWAITHRALVLFTILLLGAAGAYSYFNLGRAEDPSFTIKDADDTVAFGMTATVTLTRATDAPVARLPLSAILNRGTGPMVYLVDEAGALVQRPVTVASFTEDTALVTSGLIAGDRIVTLGVQKLEAGLKVRTIELR